MDSSNNLKSARERDIFMRALELDAPNERMVYLEGACGDDIGLRRRVDDLLQRHYNSPGFLSQPAVEGPPTLLDETPVTEGSGARIDRYKLLQKLGEGGFGVVYVAEQKEPVKRRVALKIIKLGMDTKQVVARFEAERQALAMMDHPNIAKVLDAGSTETGRPYFVMELVKGVRITRYCDDNSLTTKERLELFIPVCQAIQHAHQKGIIHRDIKPSNVMITLHDGRPVPKVIDFGIAKATQQELTEKTIFTQYSQFIGTPAYMSPEQAEMSGLDVDTRSDIYSLGVLLYELLVGRTPLNAEELMSGGYDEIRRRIKEEEAPKPSTRVSTMEGSEKTTVARHRKIGPDQLSSELRGDLDWIVLKAVDKDRTRRYETANGFALDIQRFLKDEPVTAVAPSRAYLMRKYVRRHKASLTIATVIVGLLIAGVATSSILAIHATRAQKSAEAAQLAELNEKLEAQKQRELAQQMQLKAEEQTAVAVQAQEAFRKQVYTSDMHLASLAHEAGNITYVHELLGKHWPEPGQTNDVRGFEWFYWWKAAHAQVGELPPAPPLNNFDISPDYRLSAVNVWAMGVVVRSTTDDRPVISSIRGAPCLAFSPDGAKLILGGNPLSLVDTTTWKQQDLPVPGEGWLTCLAFSPQQSTMASISHGTNIVLWNTETWETVGQPWPTDGRVRDLAFTRDGRHLITAMDDSRVVVWDAAIGTVARTLTGHAKSVQSVVCSAASDLFVTGSGDETVRLWNGSFELIGTCDVSAPITVLEFSRDGQKLLGGTSLNNSVLVWNVGQQPPSLDLVHVIKGHTRRITGLGLLADDGNRFVSVSDDGSTKFWDLTKGQPSVRVGQVSMREPNWGNPARLDFTDDGQGLWMSDPDAKRYRVNLDSHGVVALPDPQGFHTLAVSADRDWEAGVVTDDRRIAIRNSRDGALRARHPVLAADVVEREVGVFSVGPTVVWKGKDTGAAYVWNVGEGTTQTCGDAIAGLPDLSPRGDRLAVYRWDTAYVYDVAADPPAVLWEHAGWGPYYCILFSPDGQFAVAAGHIGQIEIIATDTGQLVRTLKGHTDTVTSLSFSRDGRRLLSGGEDRTLRIWDFETGQLLSTFVNPDGPICSVAFSPIDDSLASLTLSGLLRLWKAATLDEVNCDVEGWIQRAWDYSGSGRLDQAFAVLDEGLRYNPNSTMLLVAQSEMLQQSGDLASALSVVTKASDREPTDLTLLREQARLMVIVGRLDDAATCYRRILKLSPADPEDWMRTAALLISTVQMDSYHEICKDMLKRFWKPEAQDIAEKIAKASLMVPPVESNLPAAVALAEKSVSDPDHWVIPYATMVRGLAEYRQGNFQAARDWSQQALEKQLDWHVEANACLVLAMSELHLGQTPNVQTTVDRTKAILDGKAASFTGGNLDDNWHDWFFSQALLKEADALMQGTHTQKVTK